MEFKSEANDWRISIGRKSRCILCKRHLRLPCPHCLGHGIKKTCWVSFDRNKGNYHEHCWCKQHNIPIKT